MARPHTRGEPASSPWYGPWKLKTAAQGITQLCGTPERYMKGMFQGQQQLALMQRLACQPIWGCR